FVRPPLPSPARDKALFGLSTTVRAQIFFRIGELLNQAKRCRSAGQLEDTFFELYARVKSSSRPSPGRLQYFQFKDLFNNHPPYLPGTLSGWRMGSVVDKDSAVFLGVFQDHSLMLCRCICKMEEVTKGRWGIRVMAIQKSDWEVVDSTKRLLFAAI
ncbi:hypothetical protein QBC39DRAFT_245916, partial [Podospora conica]